MPPYIRDTLHGMLVYLFHANCSLRGDLHSLFSGNLRKQYFKMSSADFFYPVCCLFCFLFFFLKSTILHTA